MSLAFPPGRRRDVELLPTRATYAPGTPVGIEVRGLTGAAELSVWHLGEHVATVSVDGPGTTVLDPLPEGGYGIELVADRAVGRTAVDVRTDPRSRLRYGFVASYPPGRDVRDVVDNVRRLHLTGVQFYDWAYRHADLLGGGPEYEDPLGQPVALETVRALTKAVQEAGADALGYAAVYAVGPQEWDRWKYAALQHHDGRPYSLGDFLYILDPADAGWLQHFGADLAAAAEQVGFDGFHLDQYGYPRRAVRADGRTIDVAESFMTMIRSVRGAVPDARLVFNNVNDFPTWRSASAPQDAVYIEAWVPHTTLGSLAQLVTRARSAAEGKPVVIAAYQHVYDSAPATAADLATSFTMATLYSHGATQLLAGEGDRVLVDPYYVRNHRAGPGTQAMLKRWYDFQVEHDELLLAPAIADVTGAWVGPYNEVLDVTYGAVRTSAEPVPGTVWTRVTDVDGRLVLHLINLAGQDDALWDGAKRIPEAVGAGTLRVRRVGDALPRLRIADPDLCPRLRELPVRAHGDFAVVDLPQPHVWQVVVIDL